MIAILSHPDLSPPLYYTDGLCNLSFSLLWAVKIIPDLAFDLFVGLLGFFLC